MAGSTSYLGSRSSTNNESSSNCFGLPARPATTTRIDDERYTTDWRGGRWFQHVSGILLMWPGIETKVKIKGGMAEAVAVIWTGPTRDTGGDT